MEGARTNVTYKYITTNTVHIYIKIYMRMYRFYIDIYLHELNSRTETLISIKW